MYVLKTKAVTLKTCWFRYVVTTRKHKANILLFHNFLKSLIFRLILQHCSKPRHLSQSNFSIFSTFFQVMSLSIKCHMDGKDPRYETLHFTCMTTIFFYRSIFSYTVQVILVFHNIHTTLHQRPNIVVNSDFIGQGENIVQSGYLFYLNG